MDIKLVVAIIIVVPALLIAVLPHLFPSMLGRSPFFQQFRETNNKLSLGGKRVLVVGGTQGIGAATAVRFAQLGADVTIAGRNQAAGDTVIEKMRSVAPTTQSAGSPQNFEFRKVDMLVVADIKRFANDYSSTLPADKGLNVLVISSGGLNYGDKGKTTDGLEHNFAISYFSRFLLINKLIPSLLKADSSRVVSVLSAGRSGPIDLDDVQLQKPGAYSKFKSEKHNSISNDFMMEEFTRRYSKDHDVSFFHVMPGGVATDILKNAGGNGFLNGCLKSLTSLLGQQPEEYAESAVYISTSPELTKLSGTGLNRDAEPIKRTADHEVPGAAEKLWDYSWTLAGLSQD